MVMVDEDSNTLVWSDGGLVRAPSVVGCKVSGHKRALNGTFDSGFTARSYAVALSRLCQIGVGRASGRVQLVVHVTGDHGRVVHTVTSSWTWTELGLSQSAPRLSR